MCGRYLLLFPWCVYPSLQGQLAIETGKQVIFTAPQIEAFLYSLKKGKVDDENNRKGIINIFLRAVYLWDDKIMLILNGGDKPTTIEDILLDEIEANNEAFVSSSMVMNAPPKIKGKKDLLLTKPVNPSLSRASTMKSGSPFLVDLLG